MGTGRLVLMGLMACALTACSSESADVGAFGVAADAGADARPLNPDPDDAQAKTQDAAAAVADSSSAADAVAIEACPIGVTRCHEYRQERCEDPAAGWSNLKTQTCCVDEARFRYDIASMSVSDSKSMLSWKRVAITENCTGTWRFARLAEIRTLEMGLGACSPASDRRYFSDAVICDRFGTDCLDMTTMKIVPNGTGESFCVR